MTPSYSEAALYPRSVLDPVVQTALDTAVAAVCTALDPLFPNNQLPEASGVSTVFETSLRAHLEALLCGRAKSATPTLAPNALFTDDDSLGAVREPFENEGLAVILNAARYADFMGLDFWGADMFLDPESQHFVPLRKLSPAVLLDCRSAAIREALLWLQREATNLRKVPLKLCVLELATEGLRVAAIAEGPVP